MSSIFIFFKSKCFSLIGTILFKIFSSNLSNVIVELNSLSLYVATNSLSFSKIFIPSFTVPSCPAKFPDKFIFFILVSISSNLKYGMFKFKSPLILVFSIVLSVFIVKSDVKLKSDRCSLLFLIRLVSKSLSIKNLSIFNFKSKFALSFSLLSLNNRVKFIFLSSILIFAPSTNLAFVDVISALIFSIFLSSLFSNP